MSVQKTPLEVAINILLEAAEIGRLKGAYTFQESSIINEQIIYLTTPPAPPVVEEDEVVEEEIPQEELFRKRVTKK
jgi:hypothetical protein